MLKKIGKVLFHNLGLKIAALLAAIVIWFVIININDPEISRNFSCAVTVENADALTAQGKTYEITDGSTAYFSVKAPRSVMKNLSESDFRAIADMSNVQDYQFVPINITALRYNGQLEITKITKYLEISTEDMQTGQFIITPEQSGTPAKGYMVGSLSVAPNVLKVSGPASVVSKIERVVATINVDNIVSDISDSVIPQLFDGNDKAIDTTRLVMNLTSVIVRADIYSVKDVAISVDSTGEPAEGYAEKEIIYEPDSVKVMGDTAILNKLTQITIPNEVLDVTDATEDVTATVDVTAYLPDGVSIADSAEKDIDIAAVIEKLPSDEEEEEITE